MHDVPVWSWLLLRGRWLVLNNLALILIIDIFLLLPNEFGHFRKIWCNFVFLNNKLAWILTVLLFNIGQGVKRLLGRIDTEESLLLSLLFQS